MENNKENFSWAAALIAQLSALPGFPINPVGVKALVERFLAMLPHREAGEWTIQTALDEQERYPPPAILREICERRWLIDMEKAAGRDYETHS